MRLPAGAWIVMTVDTWDRGLETPDLDKVTLESIPAHVPARSLEHYVPAGQLRVGQIVTVSLDLVEA